MTLFIVFSTLAIAAGVFLLGQPLIRRETPRGVRALEAELAAISAAQAAGRLAADEAQAQREKVSSALTDALSQPATPRDRGSLLALVVIIPVLTIGLYAIVGTPDALSPPPAAADAPNLDSAVASLRERLESEPGDIEGWLLLGPFLQIHAALCRCRRGAPSGHGNRW